MRLCEGSYLYAGAFYFFGGRFEETQLRYSFGISRRRLQVVFETYVSLKELIMHSYSCEGRTVTTLDGESFVPWACKVTQHLEFIIELPELQNLYYNRKSLVLSEIETRLFQYLERIYRQFGSPVVLKLLDLHAVYVSEGLISIGYKRSRSGANTFRALISLGDNGTGRPGCFAVSEPLDQDEGA